MKDLMGSVGHKTSEIIGFIRVTVFEAKNIAILDEKTKTSDPYCKLYFGGWTEKKTTEVIKKNLNPVWNRQYHSWIFDPKQTDLRIEVWDEDTIRDDFAGLITINFPLQDTVIDQWFDLKGREGKKDKHVQGSIHVRIEVGMTKRNVATSIWTKPSFIMVDPDTSAYMLEIQGDVDEELMNIIVAGIILPAPQRFYNKDGSPSSWRISVPVRPAGGKMSDDHMEQKRLTDRMQNYMITLWNRLRELGWFYVCKNGDNLLFLNFPSNAPWFAPPPFAMKPVAYPGYITVDQRPTLSQLEIQGEIDEAIVREAAGSHKVERIDDKDGTFLRWRICVSIGIVSIFAQQPSRRESQRFQLALLQILQVLGRHGYIYISDYYLPGWGEFYHKNEDQYHSFYYSRQDVREKTHILYRDVSTFYYATSVCPPTYLLVDPRPFDWKVSIQGPLDIKMFKEFNPSFPEPKDFQDKDGTHLSWQWRVQNSEKMTWSEKAWKRVENRFQNYILNVYDAISRMGFRFVIDIGKTALFVTQGPPEPTTAHLTVDLGWFDKKPIMEFQGTIDGTLLNEIGSATGLNAAQQILDSDGTHLCYSSPIPYDKEGTFASYEERKRVQNQFQCYVLNAFDLLSKVGFSYVTAQKNTHIFQKREIPTPVPLVSWLLVDPSYIKGRGSVVEIQGQIDPVVLAKIAEALSNPGEPLTNSKTGSSFGWVFVVPDTSSFAWSTTTYKRQENMQQNYSLKILTMLYSFGWFPVDKVDTSAGIFLTRNLQ